MDSIKALFPKSEDLGTIASPENVGADLHLFQGFDDPLEAARTLADNSIDAAPNYIYAFAPAWMYAPFGPPSAQNVPPSPPLRDTTKSPIIAVLDTGWTAVSSPSATVASGKMSSLPPQMILPNGATAATVANGAAAPTEVTTGVAAGHGTFIINELGRILPNATYAAEGISARFPGDNNYQYDGKTVAIRDDAMVLAALADIDRSATYLNVSFGTYGCTAKHDPKIQPEGMEPWLTPLGFRTALETLQQRQQVEVFAASGNDSHGPFGLATGEIFYPAGFAPLYPWLHSVASDPKGTTDYSNRGPWVETQARGSQVVSQLPTTDFGGEGWYEWSGTSFATPCALANAVISGNTPAYQPVNPKSGTDQYIECGLNL